MSEYIKRNLGPDEKVIMVAERNFLCFIPMLLSIVIQVIILSYTKRFVLYIDSLIGLSMPSDMVQIFSIGVIVCCAPVIIKNILRIISVLNTQLVITNKRVLGKVGVLSIKALDYPIEKVDHVSLSAGIFGNLFKYYDLYIKSVGDGTNSFGGEHSGIKFSGIKNATEFKNHITLAIEQHAEEARRLQAEEIAKAMAKKP